MEKLYTVSDLLRDFLNIHPSDLKRANNILIELQQLGAKEEHIKKLISSMQHTLENYCVADPESTHDVSLSYYLLDSILELAFAEHDVDIQFSHAEDRGPFSVLQLFEEDITALKEAIKEAGFVSPFAAYILKEAGAEINDE